MINLNPYVDEIDQEVMAADPVRLVLLLLRGAKQSVEEARSALHRGDARGRSLAVSRATERIAELFQSLDRQRGGEIAARLSRLYEYMVHRLNEANVNQAEAPLSEVSGLISTLVEAWSELQAASVEGCAWTEAPAGQRMDCQA